MFTIVIPAYNEEGIVAETVAACHQVIESLKPASEAAEVLIVDDGSTDRTAERAEQAGARVLRHPHNMGYGYSLKDGIRQARNDTIVITDADGTYPIDRIPDLLAEYEKGFDMVVGARQGKHYDESFSKKIFRRVLKGVVEFTVGKRVPDVNSGLRVFSRKGILPLFYSLCDTFSFTTSMTIGYAMSGKFVSDLPIDYGERTGKTKVRLFRDSLRTLQFIVEAILIYNPIKVFLTFSIALFCLAALSMGPALIWEVTAFYVLSLGCILIAIFMFGAGLLSVLLKQILHMNRQQLWELEKRRLDEPGGPATE